MTQIADCDFSVRLSELHCAGVSWSALGISRFTARVGCRQLEVTEVGDVLYLPSLGLQIVDRSIVPLEGLLNPYDLDALCRLRDDRHDVEIAAAVDDQVCVIANPFSMGFFHIYEELLKVITLETNGFKGKYLVYAEPSYCRELLQLLGVEDRRILSTEAPILLKRAIFVEPLSYLNVHRYRDVLFRLRDVLLEACGSDTDAGPRIWVCRGTGAKRQGDIHNKDEVAACLARYDFRPIDFGSIPLNQQVSIWSHATAAAGPHGAAFTQCFLMPRRSTVVECFTPKYVHPCVVNVCGAMSHHYYQVVTAATGLYPYQWGKDIEVNCDQLAGIFQNLPADR